MPPTCVETRIASVLAGLDSQMIKADGSNVSITDLKNIEQKLDLWGGILTSSFQVDDVPVRVQTAVHPERDEVGIMVESPLLASGRLKIRLAFPYASAFSGRIIRIGTILIRIRP